MDAKGNLEVGDLVKLNGEVWCVTGDGRMAANALMVGDRSYAIELRARPPMVEPTLLPRPKQRNDRAYLKRKKGRS